MRLPSSSLADGPAAPVTSRQAEPHSDLERRVLRHRHGAFQRPPARHTVDAFAAADAVWRASGLPLVLDSGCGTGESTRALAAAHPQAFVIGIDKSAVRLARAVAATPAAQTERLLYVRAELHDLWRLAVRAGWPVAAHYVLYPNPWPKYRHLRRRWHAHPAMPALVGLGGWLELRTNWYVYAQEFAQALQCYDVRDAAVSTWMPSAPISAFERKFAAGGQRLYRVVADLDRDGYTGRDRPAQNQKS